MNKSIIIPIGVVSLLIGGDLKATTVKTCSLDYSGVFNAVRVNEEKVIGIAKIFAKEADGIPFTLVTKNDSEYERFGTITSTVDITSFVSDGESCNFDNRFTPIHSVSDSSPWRQFQMRFDSYYDSNIVVKYNHNGIETDLMIANGWTWGADMANIHVFEMIDGEFFPVKQDLDKGNGELAAYVAGGYPMSTSGDKGQWQYRASAASDDGRLIAGYAKLEESVTFENGDEIDNELKFGMIWEVTDSCTVDSSKCNNSDASRLTSGSENTPSLQVRSISAPQLGRNMSAKAIFTNGENVTIKKDYLQQEQILLFDNIPSNFTFGYEFTSGSESVQCTLIGASGALAISPKKERHTPYVIFGDYRGGADYETRHKSIIDEGGLTLTISAFDDENCDSDAIYTDSLTVTINKTDNIDDGGTETTQVGEITGKFYIIDREEHSNDFGLLTYDPDNTMESVFGVTTISPGRYVINGRSHSGKAMLALVEL